jgi:hypothetical protein
LRCWSRAQWIGGQATAQGVTRWDEAGMDLMETTGEHHEVVSRSAEHAIRALVCGPTRRFPNVRYKISQYFNPGVRAAELSRSRSDPSVAHSRL